MEKRTLLHVATALAVVLAFLRTGGTVLAAPHAFPSSDPGISAHTIKLGGVLDQSGRGSLIAVPILHGYQLAIRELNAHGGINGRKIDYVANSDNYDPSQTLTQLKQVVEADGVFAVLGVFGSDDANVAAPYLERRHIPFFDPIGGGVNMSGKHWIWQSEPDYAREGKVIAKFAATKLHARHVAVLYQLGIGEPQVSAIRMSLPKYHAQLVATASYASTDTNLAGQVARLKSANPDLIVLNGTPTPTQAFLQYASLVGFKPRYGFIANYPMGDPLWLALIGSNGEGNYVSSYADLTGHNKVATQYRNAITAYQGDKYSNYGLYGYFNANLLFRALKLVGKQLTRSRLQYVLDNYFRHYTTGFTGKLNWTPSQRFGVRQFKMYQIHNGGFVPVTGWLSP